MRYYIQDTRGFVGDSVMWWRPDGKGYTINLEEAGEYDEEKARAIETNRSTDKPIPCEVARAASSTHVMADRLRAAFVVNEVPTPQAAPIVPAKRTCNRHDDCDEADKKAVARGSKIGGAEHCHDDCCEECFGN